MSNLIETTELAKTYHGDGAAVHALRGVDLAVEQGEFVAVMGPSGCGKSTLLHLLGGLDRPTAGQVRLDGTLLNDLSESQLAVLRRTHVGFVFQFYNLIGNLSVADNVELPGLVAGRSPREVARRREELLEALGIADKAGQVPARLSAGEQQRAAIARALINEPAVLLADEPTGNLDTRSGAEVLELFRRFNERGQTIVLVTHDPRVASSADRVLFLRDGRIVDQTRLVAGQEMAAVLAKLVEMEM